MERKYICNNTIKKKDVRIIDGMDSLLRRIAPNEFVKLAVEPSTEDGVIAKSTA